MASKNDRPAEQSAEHDADNVLNADDAAEVIEEDGDVHMDSDNDDDGNGNDNDNDNAHRPNSTSNLEGLDDPEEDANELDDAATEIELVNDSIAHFSGHKDSIFCIAQHPLHPEIIVTGGGDDVAYVFDASPPERPVLPASYASDPQQQQMQLRERKSLEALAKLEGHSDSVSAVLFTMPQGDYVVTAGLDGRIMAWKETEGGEVRGAERKRMWEVAAQTEEAIGDINWLAPCPASDKPNTFALGAGEGSVWVYSVDADDAASSLTIIQAYYLHTQSCTAGAWSPDGAMLATVAEDGSFYVFDVFGDAAAAGLEPESGSSYMVGLTAQNERFKIEGGLYSVAIAPSGAFAVVGGATGEIRVVGLPRLGKQSASAPASATAGSRGAGAKSKASGGKQAEGSGNTTTGASMGQAGQILASLQAQQGSIETISFSPPPLTLMATGSVDGSIALFDTAHRFAVRRHIKEAHEDEAVIKVDFVRGKGAAAATATAVADGWLLTSCGNDGVLKRWDTRGGTAASGQGLVGEWKGHRGGGMAEEGGILGFVQGNGNYVVTAGDEYAIKPYKVFFREADDILVALPFCFLRRRDKLLVYKLEASRIP